MAVYFTDRGIQQDKLTKAFELLNYGVHKDKVATALKVFEKEVPQEKKPTIIRLINGEVAQNRFPLALDLVDKGITPENVILVRHNNGFEILHQLVSQGFDHKQIKYNLFENHAKKGVISDADAKSELFKERISTKIAGFTRDQAIAWMKKIGLSNLTGAETIQLCEVTKPVCGSGH